MALLLEEIVVELVAIAATLAGIACLVYLLVLCALERREAAASDRVPGSRMGRPARAGAGTPAPRDVPRVTDLDRPGSVAERTTRGSLMIDVLYLAIVLAFFVLTIAYARVAPKL